MRSNHSGAKANDEGTGGGGLSHIGPDGESRMVDVSAKPVTVRRAVAEGVVRMKAATAKEILAGNNPKGSVLEVARIAGIQAAKKTSELIPLCHPLSIEAVRVDFSWEENPPVDSAVLRVQAEVRITSRTGVEMEALTAVSVAALTVYDMAKAVDKAMVIDSIRLLEKHGGKSGSYAR
jgi:cyclic pyranopterin phosphate synthase